MTRRWLRVVWPVAMLLVFVASLRGLSDRARPAAPTVDCDRVRAGDVPELERCVALHPDDVELLTDAGSADEQAGRWERAEEAYRRALAIDPQDGDVRVRVGELLLRRHDAEGARGEARAALTVQPGSPAALDLLRRSGGDDR